MEPLLSADAEEIKSLSLLTPLTSRRFNALWLGQTFSQFGDAILWVALPLAVFAMGDSTLQMGFVMALLMLPQVLLLPFTGILVDRVSRSGLMMLTDVIRFLLMAGLSVLAWTHSLAVPLLDTFVLLYGAMDALFQPAYSAARAQVFTPDIRNAANGLTQVSQQAARLIGPAVGGLVVGLATVAAGFTVDAATLLISIISLAFLRLPKPDRVDTTEPTGLRGFARELAGGYVELRKHPWLWITILAFSFINIAGSGLLMILLPWLIKVHLGMSATTYGLVSSASGVGAILCAVVYGRRKRWHKRGWIAYGGVGISGVAALAIVTVHHSVWLMMIMAISGAGIMLFGLTWEGSLQELVAPESFGRVVSLDMFGSFALLPIGNVVTGWLSVKIGGITTIVVDALFVVVITVVVLMVPAIRRFD